MLFQTTAEIAVYGYLLFCLTVKKAIKFVQLYRPDVLDALLKKKTFQSIR